MVRRGDTQLKRDFEMLLTGRTILKRVDELVHFKRLYSSSDAVWSLLLATGYLRIERPGEELGTYELALTNYEVRQAFDGLVRDWFQDGSGSYNDFVGALLGGDVDGMGDYLSDLAEGVMSSFDSGIRPARNLPERFWHGLVLGLLVDLRGRYEVSSNRESGRGRVDVLLVPLAEGADPAVVLEFKVFDARQGEDTLEDTVAHALAQIEERHYVAGLVERGIRHERIYCYGIAFRGKEVLVGASLSHAGSR